MALLFSWLSTDSLTRAWEHVYDNGGCAGADGVSLGHFHRNLGPELQALQQQLDQTDYRPLPLLPITIQKKPQSRETRTLLVPAVRDRVLQTAVGRHLGRALEDEFLDCSFAYRPHRSVDSAVARIRFWRDHGFQYVADADIESFFDRIDHHLLRERLVARISEAALPALLGQWIEGPVWDGRKIEPLKRGIPQGSPISALLANFFLSDFDFALEKAGLKLIRYADDFLVLAKDHDSATRSVVIAGNKLEELHLTLKAEKTRITSFDEGFHFLGVFFSQKDIWIPWGKHNRHQRVFAVPRPMPAILVRRYLETQMPTMARAFAAERRQAHSSVPTFDPDLKDEGMAYLYLTEQGSVLRKIGNRLVVEKENAILLDTPYHKLEAVLIFGNVQVTTQAMIELLDAGIPVSFLSRAGELRGSLDPPKGKNVLLRMAQFALHEDEPRSLAIARKIVDAKLANSAQLLATFGAHGEAHSYATDAALSSIAEARRAAQTSATLEALNGAEGAAARLYFDVLM
jgi:CRISP-associated protein Cas1